MGSHMEFAKASEMRPKLHRESADDLRRPKSMSLWISAARSQVACRLMVASIGEDQACRWPGSPPARAQPCFQKGVNLAR